MPTGISSFFRKTGEAAMEFLDRLLTCADCGGEFIFTAGEQLFFFDKQFKNDPKRCKPCKFKRAGITSLRPGANTGTAGLSRTETRTQCSECGVETTVPFKPTQGRPVLCRQCFQHKQPASASTADLVAAASEGAANSADPIAAIPHA
jgi:CxxC-x17-CxxC domain-containing protein